MNACDYKMSAVAMSLLVLVGGSPTHPQSRGLVDSRLSGPEKYLGYLFIGDKRLAVRSRMKREMKNSFSEAIWKWVTDAFKELYPCMIGRLREHQMHCPPGACAEEIARFENVYRRFLRDAV